VGVARFVKTNTVVTVVLQNLLLVATDPVARLEFMDDLAFAIMVESRCRPRVMYVRVFVVPEDNLHVVRYMTFESNFESSSLWRG